MIISKTPFRISFFGGGTDIPKWYKKQNGQVLSSTINKYAYITLKYLPEIFEDKIRLVYSKTELTKNVNDIVHPSFRETLKYMGVTKQIVLHYDGDLPAYSGIGSSSTFTVGLLHALAEYKKIKLTKKQLGLKSIYIEQKKIREHVGSQDQIAASYGGLNHIFFKKNGEIIVKKINICKDTYEEFENNLLLFYTGIKRSSNIIQKNYFDQIFNRSKELKLINESVPEGIKYLKKGNLKKFVQLMHEMWNLKKQLNNKVSNKFIDQIYDEAIKAGAWGGKITGAGGGGFMLFYAPKSKHKIIKKKLRNLKSVSFKFEKKGSRIICSDQNL